MIDTIIRFHFAAVLICSEGSTSRWAWGTVENSGRENNGPTASRLEKLQDRTKIGRGTTDGFSPGPVVFNKRFLDLTGELAWGRWKCTAPENMTDLIFGPSCFPVPCILQRPQAITPVRSNDMCAVRGIVVSIACAAVLLRASHAWSLDTIGPLVGRCSHAPATLQPLRRPILLFNNDEFVELRRLVQTWRVCSTYW